MPRTRSASNKQAKRPLTEEEEAEQDVEKLKEMYNLSDSDEDASPYVERRHMRCRQKGTTIRSKERELIHCIVDACDQEAKQKCLICPLRQATRRAALYTRVSERTIKRIREEAKLGIEWSEEDYGRPKRLRMSHEFACNLSFLFQEEENFLGRYALAKEAGFVAVESGFPLGFSVEQVVRAKEEAGVDQVLINVYTGDTSKGELGFAAIPGKEEDFKKSIETTINYAKALKCKKIHVMAGKVDNPTQENHTAYENNLRYAVEKFASEDIIGLIEPINPITVPGYYLNSYERAIEVITKINSPNLRLLLDVFHLQQIQGRITNSIEKLRPYIGHVQVAQVPHRGEPDTKGEIDYAYVFRLLEEHDYKDYIGLEYKPKTTTETGLKWIQRLGFMF